MVNIAVIMALHRLPVPEIPGVPPELTAVLRDAMAADPARRTPSVAALRDALTSLRPGDDVPASPPRAPRPVSAAPAPSPPYATAPPPYGTPPVQGGSAGSRCGRI